MCVDNFSEDVSTGTELKLSYSSCHMLCCIYTPLPKVWKRLGASGNNNFCQKYNIEFLHNLTSNHCEISHRRRNIIDVLN